jgi:hypothetical protein
MLEPVARETLGIGLQLSHYFGISFQFSQNMHVVKKEIIRYVFEPDPIYSKSDYVRV